MRQLVMFFPESLLLTLWYIPPFGNQLCIKELCNYVNVLLRPYKIKSHLINKETNNSGGDGYRFSLPWAGQSIMDLPVKPNWDSHCHLCECQTIYICFSLWMFSPLILKIIILRGSTYDQKNEKSELLINHTYSILGNTATWSNCVLIFPMYSPGNTPEFNKCHLCKCIYTVYPVLWCFHPTMLK